MVIAVAELNGRAFRWNLTANVGPGQPNKLDDVELVRFGYICMKQNVKFPASSDLQEVIDKVRADGPFDTDLADAIKAHQLEHGGTQDGIVSVANVSSTSHNKERYDSSHTWIIMNLNNNMLDVAGDVYPRIDKHPQSGPEVSKVVKKICVPI